jgi:hypothetical protein
LNPGSSKRKIFGNFLEAKIPNPLTEHTRSLVSGHKFFQLIQVVELIAFARGESLEPVRSCSHRPAEFTVMISIGQESILFCHDDAGTSLNGFKEGLIQRVSHCACVPNKMEI